jgi:hypothetical protein
LTILFISIMYSDISPFLLVQTPANEIDERRSSIRLWHLFSGIRIYFS